MSPRSNPRAKSRGDDYYVLNTNRSNRIGDDEAMLTERKAAAYSNPWKFKITRLKKGDHVFLYRSGVGIVAAGKADGRLKRVTKDGQPENEYNMGLDDFFYIVPPLKAWEIRKTTRRPTLVFRQTLFKIDKKGGAKLYQVARDRAKRRPATDSAH